MRSKNLFLFLFVCLSVVGLIYSGKIDLKQKVSLEVLDLFPQNKERELLDLYRSVGDSNTIFVAQSPNQPAQQFKDFLNQVQKLPNVKEIITASSPNATLQDFIKKYYFYLGELKPQALTSKEMQSKILEAFNHNKLNPIDPLGLIVLPSFQESLTIHDLPLALIKLKDSNATAIDDLYQSFSSLAQRFGIEHYFSSAFVNVQNPKLILKEVNTLTGIACTFFVLLYFLILRIPFLTFNAIATILLSNLIAITTLLLCYPQVSIMSLSFGIGISNICIDYMMHHHFLGFYTHKKIRFNSSVFYGFLTTLIGFLICLFIPFPLLNQLSLYAIINLSVAYLCFAFLYQNITFAPPKYFSLIRKLHFSLIPVWLILIASIAMGGYALKHIQGDLNLARLDYQNKEFDTQKAFFDLLTSQETFLIKARNVNELIREAKKIASISPESVGALRILPTSQEIKRREKFYKSLTFSKQKQRFQDALFQISKVSPQLPAILQNAYKTAPSAPAPLTPQQLKDFGIDVLEANGWLYFQGFISQVSLIKQNSSVIANQPKDLMHSITSSVFAPMLSILFLAFIATMLILLVLSKKQFVNSVGFVLFPLTSTLLYLSLSTTLNIMHLFALLLIVVVGIDYGIYHIKEKDDIQAKHAIFFSTLTTLCSFGLFMFSNTRALSSFGEVIVIGMSALLVLIFFQKDWGKNAGI